MSSFGTRLKRVEAKLKDKGWSRLKNLNWSGGKALNVAWKGADQKNRKRYLFTQSFEVGDGERIAKVVVDSRNIIARLLDATGFKARWLTKKGKPMHKPKYLAGIQGIR